MLLRQKAYKNISINAVLLPNMSTLLMSIHTCLNGNIFSSEICHFIKNETVSILASANLQDVLGKYSGTCTSHEFDTIYHSAHFMCFLT